MNTRGSGSGVLHVIVPQREGAIGGSDLHVIDLSVAQRDHGEWRPTVLAPRASRDYLDRLHDAGVSTVTAPRGRVLDWYHLPVTADFGLVHAHGYEANYLVAALRRTSRRWSGLPAVVTGHGWIENTLWLRLKSALDRYSSRTADVCIASAVAHVERFPSSPDHTVVVRNGVPTVRTKLSEIRSSLAATRTRLGVPTDCFLLGVVGRLSPEKRVDLVLAAAQQVVASDNRHIHVVVVGGGADLSRLQASVEQLGIQDRVTFTGLLRDVTPAYLAMDLLIQASDTEGTPRSVLEAMAHRVPVVATDVGDLRVMLDDGRAGVLIPADDLAALVDSINEAITNPGATTSRADHAAELQAQEFSIEAMRRRVQEAYDVARARAIERGTRR